MGPMPELNVNAIIDLTAEEASAVADTLGCGPDDLQAVLAPYAAAALREYADMFAGQAMTSIADQRERRLVAILLALPPDRFPSDETIARLFNLTTAQGRALLRVTLSRHRNRLKTVMDAAARRFIAACEPAGQGGQRAARFPNTVVIDMLNVQLAAAAAPR